MALGTCWLFCAARAKAKPIGRAAAGSVSARTRRAGAGADSHRWLCRLGGGDSHGLSAGAASTLLGAQDAEHFRESAEARLRRSEDRSSGHLSGRKPGASRSRLSRLPLTLVPSLSGHGPALATGPARVAVVLRFSPAPVAQTAHHQRDRALLRRSSATHSPHGVLCECRERRSNHLLHLPEIQPGMENPHPQPIYTSSLTSPGRGKRVASDRSYWAELRAGQPSASRHTIASSFSAW